MADPVAEVKAVTADVKTEVAAVKTDVVSAESSVKAFVAKQVAWVKSNWPHVVTWAVLAYNAGALKLIAKL